MSRFAVAYTPLFRRNSSFPVFPLKLKLLGERGSVDVKLRLHLSICPPQPQREEGLQPLHQNVVNGTDDGLPGCRGGIKPLICT